MQNSEIKVSSNKSFGIVFCILFLIIACWPLMNNGEIRVWSLIISIIFLVLGLLNSKILTPLNKLWFKIGILLGIIVSPLVLGIVYFGVVTPTSIIMKSLRKDLLNLKKNNKASTYWIEKTDNNSSMKNQF